MRETVSVQQAISKGKWMLFLPMMLIFFGTIIGAVILFSMQLIPGWCIAIGFVLAFIFMWLYWSFAITKWRIWAFDNVRNVHELKRKAIQNRLIKEDGSFSQKTEIRSEAQKQKLKELEKKFLVEDVYYDDAALPKEIQIRFSKAGIVFGFILGGAFFLGALYVYILDRTNYICFLPMVLGGYFLFLSVKKITFKEPIIIINALGIQLVKTDLMSWQHITNDYVEMRRNGKYVHHYLSFDYNGQHNEIRIDDLAINMTKLEHMLQVYRVRYQKNNPS